MRRKFFFKSYGLGAVLALVALAVGEISWAQEPGAIYTIFGTHNYMSPSDGSILNFYVDIRIDQAPSAPPGSAYAWILVVVFADGSSSEGGLQWNSEVKQAKWGANLINFDWQVGQWYRYRVERVQQNPDGSWRWGFWILSYSTNQETLIGYVVNNGQWFHATNTPRVYTGAAGVACTDPSVEATWRNPVYRNGGGPFTVLSGTASYINSTCADPNNTNQWLISSPPPEWKHKTNTPRTTSGGTALWSQFQGGGTLGFSPYFQSGQEITNAVAIRYKFRVNQNSSPALKIVFTTRRLYNPSTPTFTYLLEANLYTYWVQYSDTSCQGWPPQGQSFPGQSGLWVSIPDYPGESQRPSLVGVRPSNTQVFPRQNSGIDLIPGLTKIETISQMNMTGKDVSIHYYRGNLLDPATDGLNGWGYRFQRDPQNPNIITCEPNLPSGYTYRKWHAVAVIDGTSYQWDFAVPDDSARYLATFEVMSIVTEFLAAAGFFQVYFWDFEIQREGSSIWERLNTWKVFYQPDAPTPTSGWGPKIGDYNGKPVLEVSNDGTDTYYKLNDIFQIPTSFPTPALFRIERATGNAYADGSFNPGGADLAERIAVSEPVAPGDVLELDPNNPKHYRKARTPYSPLVAGVVSTKPGIIIGQQALTKTTRLTPLLTSAQAEMALPLSLSLTKLSQGILVLSSTSVAQLAPYWEYLREDDPRPLLALLGRAPVKATTENGPIRAGDLLTSSSRPGYAMRCGDPKQCEGAIIGKALESLQQGTGLVLMLVMR